MKETISIIAASAMLVSGCGAEGTLFGTITEINTQTVPNSLPSAVEAQIPNVISLKNSTTTGNSMSVAFCSGVRVGQSEFLSAGHCDDDYFDAANAPHCITTSVETSSIVLPASYKAGIYVGSANGIDTSINAIGQDMLLVDTASQLPYATPTRVMADPASIPSGTPLFLVNYEPTADGRYRSANTSTLSQENIQAGLSNPAMFGAIVVQRVTDTRVEAVTVGKPYSSPADTEVREGASGGPVYDANGTLIGISDNVDITPKTVDQYELERHIELIGLPDDAQVNPFFIQPITAEDIVNLRSQQTAIQRC